MNPFETKESLGTLYRYEDRVYAPSLNEYDETSGPGRLDVSLRIYKIIKKTSCGVRIDDYSEKGRFVNLQSNKKFGCLTKEDALQSFVARKKRQAGILQHQLNRAIEAYQAGLRMLDTK